MTKRLTPGQYRALAEFRYQLRRFLHFSEEAARAARIEPRQHQLLLAIAGIPDHDTPSVTTLAERMQLRHHSTVELVNRCQQRGLVRRLRGSNDRRQVEVELTAGGKKLLQSLSLDHRDELRRRGPELLASLSSLGLDQNSAPVPSHKGRS